MDKKSSHSRPATTIELKNGARATMLRRFEIFGKALFAVPKKEIDAKLADYEASKRKRRKLR